MISYLLFDLDNTLYPEGSPMDADITRRMASFVASYLGVTTEKAKEMRQKALGTCGTTLGWLKTEHGLTDIDSFFNAVHPPCETDGLIPDPNLRPYLMSLEYPMAILTNAPIEHATRVLDFFNVSDLFRDKVFDIRFSQFHGKPAASAFTNVLKAVGFSVEQTLFLDDSPRYVEGFAEIGGNVALIDQFDKYLNKPYNRIHSIYDLKTFLHQ